MTKVEIELAKAALAVRSVDMEISILYHEQFRESLALRRLEDQLESVQQTLDHMRLPHTIPVIREYKNVLAEFAILNNRIIFVRSVLSHCNFNIDKAKKKKNNTLELIEFLTKQIQQFRTVVPFEGRHGRRRDEEPSD